MSDYVTDTIHTNFGQGSDFGHADYYAAKKAGIGNERILKWMEDNQDKLEGKNIIGGGGLYDEISKMGKGRDYTGSDESQRNDTKWGWMGNKNTFDEGAHYLKTNTEAAQAIDTVNTWNDSVDDGTNTQSVWGYNPVTGAQGHDTSQNDKDKSAQDYADQYKEEVKSKLKSNASWLNNYSFTPHDTTTTELT